MELLDVVSENNELLNFTKDREIVHEQGLFHREVAFWVINEQNEILLARRSLNKKQAPGKWEFSAGHIIAGDTPDETVIKEANEELGIKLKPEDIRQIAIKKIEKCFNPKQFNNFFQYTYFIKTNNQINEFTIDKNELSEIRYISIDALKNIINIKDDNYIFTDDNFAEYMTLIISELERLSLA